MKIKKFKNIWTMGLIIFGVILVAFYLLKIINPEFIVGIAEIPEIVNLGNYIVSNKWAEIVFYLITGYVGYYLICCISCRKHKLNIKENIAILFFTMLLYAIQQLLPQIYTPINYVFSLFVPFTVLYLQKNINTDTFISTVACFCIDIVAQALSMQIRNVVLMTTCINPASMIILLIDTWIWRALMYCYFNFKNKEVK